MVCFQYYPYVFALCHLNFYKLQFRSFISHYSKATLKAPLMCYLEEDIFLPKPECKNSHTTLLPRSGINEFLNTTRLFENLRKNQRSHRRKTSVSKHITLQR